MDKKTEESQPSEVKDLEELEHSVEPSEVKDLEHSVEPSEVRGLDTPLEYPEWQSAIQYPNPLICRLDPLELKPWTFEIEEIEAKLRKLDIDIKPVKLIQPIKLIRYRNLKYTRCNSCYMESFIESHDCNECGKSFYFCKPKCLNTHKNKHHIERVQKKIFKTILVELNYYIKESFENKYDYIDIINGLDTILHPYDISNISHEYFPFIDGIDTFSYQGDTLARIAVRYNHHKVLEFLLKSGADPYLCRKDKESFISVIGDSYDYGSLECLIKYGYIIEQDLLNNNVCFKDNSAQLFDYIISDIEKKMETIDIVLSSNALNSDVLNIIAEYIHTKKMFYKVPDIILNNPNSDYFKNRMILKLFTKLYISLCNDTGAPCYSVYDNEDKIIRYLAYKEDFYGKYLYKCFLQTSHELSSLDFKDFEDLIDIHPNHIYDFFHKNSLDTFSKGNGFLILTEILEPKLNKHKLAQRPDDTLLIDTINFRNDDGKSLIEIAAKNNCWETFVFLLNSGADYPDLSRQLPLLFQFRSAQKLNSWDLLSLLLKHGCVIDQKTLDKFFQLFKLFGTNNENLRHWELFFNIFVDSFRDRARCINYLVSIYGTIGSIIGEYLESSSFKIPLKLDYKNDAAYLGYKKALKCLIEGYVLSRKKNDKKGIFTLDEGIFKDDDDEFIYDVALKKYLMSRPDTYGKYLYTSLNELTYPKINR